MNDDEEMLKIAQSLRREFDELGEVTDVTKKRLKEILEDKNKREKFAEVLTKEEEVTEMSEIDDITDVPKEEQIEDLLTDFLTKRVEFEEVLTKEEERIDLIWSMLHTLTKREESVLSKYFGLYGERLTIEELGQEYHLTRDYIRRIKNKGVRKVIHRVINIDWVGKSFFSSDVEKDLAEKCVNERKSKDLDEFMMNLITGKNS